MDAENEQDAIEQEFVASWDAIEQYYISEQARLGEWAERIVHFIAELRERGYDKKFRPGLSMGHLVLSRSEYHGSLAKKPFLRIGFRIEDGMKVLYSKRPDEEVQIEVESVTLTPEVRDLLARLLAHPIG